MALITTKGGDRGMTQLNPDRIASKTHPDIILRGELDELSCALGMSGDKFDAIQTFLSEIMGYLYYRHIDTARIAEQIEALEEYITTHNNSIPTWFVNSRGSISLARAICRRAERGVITLAEYERANMDAANRMNLDPIMQYLNRLSDYLFVKSFERVVDEPQLFRDELAQPQELMAAVG